MDASRDYVVVRHGDGGGTVEQSCAVPGDAPSLALSYIRRSRVRAYDLLLAEAREDVLSLGPQDPDRRAISSKGLFVAR